MPYAGYYVEKNPTAEPDDVHPHKFHAAAETRDPLRQAIDCCSLFSGRFFEFRYGFHVLRCQLFGR